MPNSTTVPIVSHRSIAKLLGVTDQSISNAIKEGKFPKGIKETKKLGRGAVGVYSVPEDDPFLLQLIEDRNAGRPLPQSFESRAERQRKIAEEKARKEAAEMNLAAAKAAAAAPQQPATSVAAPVPPQAPPAPAAPPDPSPPPPIPPASVVPQSSGMSSSPMPGSPASASTGKSAWRTGIWVVDDRTHTSGFLRNLPGEQTDPEMLKRTVGSGSYYLDVARWDGRKWVRDEGRSIWPPMEPLMILEEDEEQVQPGATTSKPVQAPDAAERAKDSDMVRGLATKFVERAGAPVAPRDDGMSGALAQMSKSNAEAVASAAGIGEAAVSKALDTTNASITRIAEMMQRESSDRAEQHKRDMDEMRQRAEEDRKRIQAESEARLQEIHTRAEIEGKQREKEMERRETQMQREWAEQDRSNKEFIQSMTQIKDEAANTMREMQETRLETITKSIEEQSKSQEERFKEKMEYLKEVFEIRSSMMPGHLIADTVKALGEKFSGILGPALAQGGFGMPGVGIGQAPNGQTGPMLLSNGSAKGGPQMSILAKIKASPEGKEMLKDLLVSAAANARDDDPVDLFGQGILSAVSSVPMFATALAELYKTPLADIVHGVLDAGSEEYKILTSEKGAKFWAALHEFLKDYYRQMAAARMQPQAPPAK